MPPPYHVFCDNLQLCNDFTMNSRTVSRFATTVPRVFFDSLRLLGPSHALRPPYHVFCDSLKFCNDVTMNSRTVSGFATTIPCFLRQSKALQRLHHELEDRLTLCDHRTMFFRQSKNSRTVSRSATAVPCFFFDNLRILGPSHALRPPFFATIYSSATNSPC